MSAKTHGITLYGYWRSSSAWRVRIALGFKELGYRYEAVHLLEGGGRQHDSAFKAKNPMEQIPLLEIEDGGELVRIGQSMAIIDYLDARFPEPHKLVPDDAYHAAKARQLAEIVNSGIQPLQNLRVLQAVEELGGDKKAWATKWISTGLDALEVEAHALAGRYAIGDRVTIADLFLVPQIYNARRFDVDMAQYPTLSRIERACNELPPFHAAHPDRQPDAAA